MHHERGTDPATVSFGRGRPMPLFLGAGSRIIIAALPASRQRKLYAAHPQEAEAAGLGADWRSVRAALERLRRAGHAVSMGELDAQNIGVAAPIIAEDALPASLVLVLGRQRYTVADKPLVAGMVMNAARRIEAALDPNAAPALPARRRATA